MKKISALVLAATLVSTAAFAGGPVVAPSEGEPAVVVAGPASSISGSYVLPLLLLAVLAAAAMSSNSSN